MRPPRPAFILAPLVIILLMGVAGSGKTTVGQRLAASLGCEFADADVFHSDANRARMSRGLPLDDADRAPWLAALAAAIDGWLRDGRSVVLACSALKRSYRTLLRRDAEQVRLVYLRGSPELIRRRLEQRVGHFATGALLASQLEALEEPDFAVTVDVAPPAEAVVAAIRAGLGLGES